MLASNKSNIHWELVGKAFKKNLTTAKQRQVTKHAVAAR
jgi:hypothetical protein